MDLVVCMVGWLIGVCGIQLDLSLSLSLYAFALNLSSPDPSFHSKRARTQSGDLATVESIQYKLMTEEERERAKRKTAFTG